MNRDDEESGGCRQRECNARQILRFAQDDTRLASRPD